MIEIRWLVKDSGEKVLQYNEYETDDEGRQYGYGWQDVPIINETKGEKP